MISSQDLFDDLNFSKNEVEVLKEISSSLNESFEEDSFILETEHIKEMLDQFAPDNIPYWNAVDRTEILEENVNTVLCQHPSILLDKQAYRFAAIAAGFLNKLKNHLIEKIEDE
jgi:hypothetical protein